MPDSDDPFLQPDATRPRPRPGADRRTSAGPVRPQAPAPVLPMEAEPISPAARALLGLGLSPLVRAASPLLLLMAQMRETASPRDVPSLRRHALEEIRQFEDQARSSGVPNEVVLAARYTLCAGLDEAVLSTPWGNQSEWAQHPLLVALHREAWGGEKFFEMLSRISQDPPRYIDLMELQYLVLAFGFAGKYQVQERGHERLLEIQQDLYRKIRSHRGSTELDLSLRWAGLEYRRNPLVRYVPWWVVGAAALPIIAIAFTLYRGWLGELATPIRGELAQVGMGDFAPPPEPLPVIRTAGPTLKQLLAGERLLSVVEEGNLTTITLVGNDLFKSGKATINADYVAALRPVTVALNKVPGRVRVEGHTDDQPFQSPEYADNFELSLARAVSVLQVLQQQGIDNFARLTPLGRGPLFPLYRPASDPINRARNRRVVIIHLREE
jgi:type VI secretion system protein ImpK